MIPEITREPFYIATPVLRHSAWGEKAVLRPFVPSFRSIPSRFRGQHCTIRGFVGSLRTSVVRWDCLGEIAVFVALSVFLHAPEAWAADPPTPGEQQRQQARGWLQLKQDQKTYREGVEPLAPREAQSLDRLEQRQQSDARQRGQRQRQSPRADGNRQHGGEVEHRESQRVGVESQRQLERRRLDMRIQRETLRPGLR